LKTWFSPNFGLSANRDIGFVTQRIPFKPQLYGPNSAFFSPITAITVVFVLHWQNYCNYRKWEGCGGNIDSQKNAASVSRSVPLIFQAGVSRPVK
jgi:hypothetical protein